MSWKEVRESLELFLNEEKSEEVLGRLEKFEEDKELLERLEQHIGKKELNQYSAAEFSKIIDILENVIMPDYPVENPAYYSSLYINAINNDRLKTYAKVLRHLGKVSETAKEIVSTGFCKNKTQGEKSYSNEAGRDQVDNRPYITEKGSYLYFMKWIIIEDRNSRDQKIDVDMRLDEFRQHFESLKEKGIDIGKLVEAGYCPVVQHMDEMYHKKGGNLTTEWDGLADMVQKLDENGFDIYHSSTLSTILTYMNAGEWEKLAHLSGYLGKEAFMYLTGIHLKKEKKEEAKKIKKSKKPEGG